MGDQSFPVLVSLSQRVVLGTRRTMELSSWTDRLVSDDFRKSVEVVAVVVRTGRRHFPLKSEWFIISTKTNFMHPLCQVVQEEDGTGRRAELDSASGAARHRG